MKKAAVLGHPISHSLSPKLHNYWLKKYNINGEYIAIDTPAEILAQRLTQLIGAGYSGVNLTIPLKEQVLPLLDEISDQAKQIGAVNTVIFSQGKIIGKNTDAYGFIENLREDIGNISQYVKHPVVLGAGGAARAVISGLLAEGAEQIILLNRTRETAEIISKMHPAIKVEDWDKRSNILEDASLLVNTTSLGMKNQPDLDISLKYLPVNTLVTDIVYNPLKTKLLEQAEVRGNKVVDGLGMLIHQAAPAFEEFFGQKPEVDEEIRGILK